MKPHFGGDPPRPRKAGPRRKVARKAPARPYQRPGARRPPAEPAFSPMTVFLLIVALGVAALLAMALKPRDLSGIDGYPAELVTSEPRNLLQELQEALDPTNTDARLTFTEAEINRYLNDRISGKQGGPLSVLAKYEGLYADLHPDHVELFLVRSVAGLPFTVSLRLTVRSTGLVPEWRAGGGSIGSFNQGTRQFKPVIDTFLRLRGACKDEIDAIQQLKIELGDGRVTFHK